MTEEDLQAQLEEQAYARAQEEDARTREASQGQFEAAFNAVRPPPPGLAPRVDRNDVMLGVASAQQAASLEGASRSRPVPKKAAIKPIATATPDPVSVAQKAKPITNQAASASPKFATKERAESGGYRVKAGDSLSVIAQQHGTTVAELARLNGIKDINFIRKDDVLIMPGDDADPAPIDKPQSGVVNRGLRDTSGINVRRDFGGAVETAAPELYAFNAGVLKKGYDFTKAAMAARAAAKPAPRLVAPTSEAMRAAQQLNQTIARSPHKFRR
jgi:LysM repeat protein